MPSSSMYSGILRCIHFYISFNWINIEFKRMWFYLYGSMSGFLNFAAIGIWGWITLTQWRTVGGGGAGRGAGGRGAGSCPVHRQESHCSEFPRLISIKNETQPNDQTSEKQVSMCQRKQKQQTIDGHPSPRASEVEVIRSDSKITMD